MPTLQQRRLLLSGSGYPVVPLPSIAGQVFWLPTDAANLYSDAGVTLATNGQAVQQANDLSPAANHLSQATLANRPLYVTGALNGKSILRSDGSNDALSNAAPASLPAADSALTMIALCKPVTLVAGNRSILGYGSQAGTNTTPSLLFPDANTLRFNVRGVNIDIAFPVSPVGQIVCAVMRYNPTGKALTGRIPSHNLSGASTLTGTVAFVGTNLSICAGPNGVSDFGRIDWGEGFIYAATLSDAEVNSLLAYLSGRFQVGLARL